MAMQHCGASTRAVDALIADLQSGADLDRALDACGAPAEAAAFVRDTFSIIGRDKLAYHRRCIHLRPRRPDPRNV